MTCTEILNTLALALIVGTVVPYGGFVTVGILVCLVIDLNKEDA